MNYKIHKKDFHYLLYIMVKQEASDNQIMDIGTVDNEARSKICQWKACASVWQLNFNHYSPLKMSEMKYNNPPPPKPAGQGRAGL